MQKQKGFAHIALLGLILILFAVAVAGVVAYRANKNTGNDSTPRIKSIGINLDSYDQTTGMAGDIKFTNEKFASDIDLIFFEYGMQIEANSASQARRNPQPTFIVPLGTKVQSLVDGKVISIPTLYSGDYSIHVQPDGSDLIFETEHVINVSVKEGDTVSAGQEIAEVSDYDARNYAGLGLYEIGILKPGNPPSHVCPFEYLDDSIREDISTKLTGLMKAWEEFRNNPNLYNESSVTTPGCQTLEAIEG